MIDQLAQKKGTTGLLRILGVGFGVAMLIGNSVGAGIIALPGIVAGYVPDPPIILGLWVLGGLLAVAGSLVYSEAAVAYPYAGGPFVLAEKLFGKRAGFTVGLIDWLHPLSGNAALAIAAAGYIHSLAGVDGPASATAATVLVVLSTTQWFGVKLGSAVQQGLSTLKALGLLFLVIAFFMHDGAGTTTQDALPAASPTITLSVLLLAFRSILFTYYGWSAPIYFAEENERPERSLPRSLIGGVILLTLLYLAINAALIRLMPMSTLSGSELAVADGAAIIFGDQAKVIITALSIIVILSSVYAGMLFTPRILFGMARSGSFFPFAARLNRYRTPGLALITTNLFTLAFLFSGSFEFIAGITTLLFLLIDATVYVAMLCSRWKGKAATPFKAPGFPLPHVSMLVINIALITGVCIEDPRSGVYTLVIVLTTLPLYEIFKRIVRQRN